MRAHGVERDRSLYDHTRLYAQTDWKGDAQDAANRFCNLVRPPAHLLVHAGYARGTTLEVLRVNWCKGTLGQEVFNSGQRCYQLFIRYGAIAHFCSLSKTRDMKPIAFWAINVAPMS
ncbi:hypothetical protein D9M70_608340 [compost metagenome]